MNNTISSSSSEELHLQPYFLTNENGIGFGDNRIEGTNFRVQGRHYTLAEDGVVYHYGGNFECVPLDHPETVAEVHYQAEMNQAIRKERAMMAFALSGGDEIHRSVLEKHLDHTNGVFEPVELSGGVFYQVGKSDFYNFYLGLVDGQLKTFVQDRENGDQVICTDYREDGYLGDQPALEFGCSKQKDRLETPLVERSYGSNGGAVSSGNGFIDYSSFSSRGTALCENL